MFKILVLSFFLMSCSLIEHATESPLVAEIAVRQAVVRYIDRGENESEKYGRAENVVSVAQRTLDYLQGNPETTVAGIMDVIDSEIDWSRLSAADRLLVRDIMATVQHRLQSREAEIPSDTLLTVRSLLRTTVAAAQVFI